MAIKDDVASQIDTELIRLGLDKNGLFFRSLLNILGLPKFADFSSEQHKYLLKLLKSASPDLILQQFEQLSDRLSQLEQRVEQLQSFQSAQEYVKSQASDSNNIPIDDLSDVIVGVKVEMTRLGLSKDGLVALLLLKSFGFGKWISLDREEYEQVYDCLRTAKADHQDLWDEVSLIKQAFLEIVDGRTSQPAVRAIRNHVDARNLIRQVVELEARNEPQRNT